MGNFGICGAGMVGRATGESLEIKLGGKPLYYDVKEIEGVVIEESFDSFVKRCHTIFICVPTPTVDGVGDFSLVDECALSICTSAVEPTTIVQRSTCLPGYGDSVVALLERSGFVEGRHFEYLVNPEFLSRATALYDALNPHAFVIGKSARRKLPARFAKLVKLWNCPNVVMTTRRNAEAIKYASNYALSAIMSLWNELYLNSSDLCDEPKLLEAICGHPLLLGMRRVFGKAYGGPCLPKDTEALLTWAKQNDLWMPMLQATVDINARMAAAYGIEHRTRNELGHTR